MNESDNNHIGGENTQGNQSERPQWPNGYPMPWPGYPAQPQASGNTAQQSGGQGYFPWIPYPASWFQPASSQQSDTQGEPQTAQPGSGSTPPQTPGFPGYFPWPYPYPPQIMMWGYPNQVASPQEQPFEHRTEQEPPAHSDISEERTAHTEEQSAEKTSAEEHLTEEAASPVCVNAKPVHEYPEQSNPRDDDSDTCHDEARNDVDETTPEEENPTLSEQLEPASLEPKSEEADKNESEDAPESDHVPDSVSTAQFFDRTHDDAEGFNEYETQAQPATQNAWISQAAAEEDGQHNTDSAKSAYLTTSAEPNTQSGERVEDDGQATEEPYTQTSAESSTPQNTESQTPQPEDSRSFRIYSESEPQAPSSAPDYADTSTPQPSSPDQTTSWTSLADSGSPASGIRYSQAQDHSTEPTGNASTFTVVSESEPQSFDQPQATDPEDAHPEPQVAQPEPAQPQPQETHYEQAPQEAHYEPDPQPEQQGWADYSSPHSWPQERHEEESVSHYHQQPVPPANPFIAGVTSTPDPVPSSPEHQAPAPAETSAGAAVPAAPSVGAPQTESGYSQPQDVQQQAPQVLLSDAPTRMPGFTPERPNNLPPVQLVEPNHYQEPTPAQIQSSSETKPTGVPPVPPVPPFQPTPQATPSVDAAASVPPQQPAQPEAQASVQSAPTPQPTTPAAAQQPNATHAEDRSWPQDSPQTPSAPQAEQPSEQNPEEKRSFKRKFAETAELEVDSYSPFVDPMPTYIKQAEQTPKQPNSSIAEPTATTPVSANTPTSGSAESSIPQSYPEQSTYNSAPAQSAGLFTSPQPAQPSAGAHITDAPDAPQPVVGSDGVPRIGHAATTLPSALTDPYDEKSGRILNPLETPGWQNQEEPKKKTTARNVFGIALAVVLVALAGWLIWYVSHNEDEAENTSPKILSGTSNLPENLDVDSQHAGWTDNPFTSCFVDSESDDSNLELMYAARRGDDAFATLCADKSRNRMLLSMAYRNPESEDFSNLHAWGDTSSDANSGQVDYYSSDSEKNTKSEYRLDKDVLKIFTTSPSTASIDEGDIVQEIHFDTVWTRES